MVGLAIARQPPTPTPTGHGIHDHGALRRAAIWYPDVPPPHLNLNEEFLAAPQAYTSEYKPLFWSCFGGPGGIYLANLIEVCITEVVGCMSFHYFKRPEVPAECRSFGRVDAEEDLPENDVKAVDFWLDGPGGEIIVRVKVWQAFLRRDQGTWLGKEGRLTRIKVPIALLASTQRPSCFASAPC